MRRRVRGGKRIRMDDPPPEYRNPMEPSTSTAEYGGQSVPEPENYASYSMSDAGPSGSSMVVEAPGDEIADAVDEENARAPWQATRRLTRSRGRGGYGGRLAESPPPSPPMRRRGRGRRGRGRGRAVAPQQAHSPTPALLPGDDETSLYNILRFNKMPINTSADKWIQQYKTNKEVALVQLMQLFINSSGCRGKVTPDMATMEHTLIIKKMTQEFDEESGEYPLIMTGYTWKKFRINFCEFIDTLVKMCQYSIIFDQFLMDNIISLLTGLSDSQVRAFRHTATLAVMKLMTALVDVAVLTSINCDNSSRQYEAEKVKAKDKITTERLEVLASKKQELKENMEELKNMLSYMFKSVFVHRYRDILADIRSLTMFEIGIWMDRLPSHFLDDLYLKYIGWTLNDKIGEVRLRCLLSLQPLYLRDELKSKLELFTSKFKERIVAMTLDKETEVAMHAVKLVIAILKMNPDMLTDKECENVYELVYSSHRGVAQAAGEFLNVRLFKPEEQPQLMKSRRGKQRGPNTQMIRDLVQFFIESELHEHGAYLVDSLIESNPMMKDWECMTDLLLEEPGPGEEALDDTQESSLIELMSCCVRQASTGITPVGRGAPKKPQQQNREQAKQVQEDRAKLTSHFMPVLPGMLDKFGTDPGKLTNLASLPQYFDLKLYTSQMRETTLQAVLTKLRDAINVHTEPDTLETISKSLEALCGEGGRAAMAIRSTLTDICQTRYREAANKYRKVLADGEEPDADDVFALTDSLKKLSVLFTCHDLNDADMWDLLFEDLPAASSEIPKMPAQALIYVIRACYFSLLWLLHTLEERLESGANTRECISTLKERLDAYTAQCRCIMSTSSEAVLRSEAYVSICDLMVVFSEKGFTSHNGATRRLIIKPDSVMQDQLNAFIQEYVFVQQSYDGQDERRIEELHKRRNYLTAFCKLVVFNISPARRAADVFKHYIKYYNDYGDIIKLMMMSVRDAQKTNCALIMELAMQSLYIEMIQKHGIVTRQLTEFTELKELAKRFSVMFGMDAVKNREAVTALHRAGIGFTATDVGNIYFLEALGEFTNKLLRQDKRTVLRYLDARLPLGSVPVAFNAPLLQYRTALMSDLAMPSAPAENGPPPAKKSYFRRNRGLPFEENNEENMNSDTEHGG